VATFFVAQSGMPAMNTKLLPSRYTDARPLAHGGMGEIFRAVDGELGREVAVKVLAERFAADESLRRRFEREALAAARLSGNPNIVTIFDVAEYGGRPMIVMEYLPGGSLEEQIADGVPRPPAEALGWLEEAALALDAAHEAGIVHRDVKPGNLLLDAHGHVKVADFGIASASGLASFTQTGTILGTTGYLSPEQALGKRATAASDLYALAVVAWELLVGKRPFASAVPTAEATAHVNTPVPSVHRANRTLPAAYDPVFERALAKSPDARYGTAAEFVGDLRRALHEDAGATRSAPRVERQTARRAARRWWIPVLVALALAAGISAAIALSRGDGPRTIVRTVAGPSETVRLTVTVSTAATTAAPPRAADGAALNNAGFAKMQDRDYAGALPLLERAVSALEGSGSTDEAYADYNLAYTRLALGRCADVLTLLDASQAIQGHRIEIDRLRKDARKRCR
jgi:eukaryotic-like serine/threonine-protein kinase